MRSLFGFTAKLLGALSIALTSAGVARAQAVMDFTEVACATGGIQGVGSPYTESGFNLITSPTAAGFVTWCGDSPNYAGPGLLITSTGGTAFLTRRDGAGFTIDAIDLARHSAGTWDAQNFTFSGTFIGGGGIAQTFTIAAQSGRPDFSTFEFNDRWTNLANVRFATQDFAFYQFTNILLDGGTLDGTVIPEPASVVLLATGFLGVFGVGVARRRNHRNA